MIIVMNKFSIKNDRVDDFLARWEGRNSYLKQMEGFIEFHLLRGEKFDEYTIISSHVKWESMDKFMAWTKSEQFKKAHEKAHESADMHFQNANLEIYEVIV